MFEHAGEDKREEEYQKQRDEVQALFAKARASDKHERETTWTSAETL